MLKYIPFAILCVAFISCKDNKIQETKVEVQEEIARHRVSDSLYEQAVIYEANIRQYSREGTFDAFTQDIPKLKALGVKIIWLMPIHPISLARRKAENNSSVEDIEDPELRKKYLGSPYAVADYKKVNPDFGTFSNFEMLIETAHANDMFVIIDWVPNHTGWDHPWITEHPEFYTKNEQGEIVDPINDKGEPWGWTDVADLNYENEAMQKEMIDAMKFWITEQQVDGFRCDVAHGVPKSFWQKAIPALRAEKPVFMMAEAEIPDLMTDDLFDMSYGWEGHHVLNAIAKGEKSVTDFDRYMRKNRERWANDDILMNFVTNHDENAWAGPVKERMGNASEAMLALTYCMPGMPLIYSGQEYELDHRLKFFEKDSIPKKKGKTWDLLEKLGALKNNTMALAGGKDAASYERISTSRDSKVLAFRRKKGQSEIIYLANLTDQAIDFTLSLEGDFVNAFTDEGVRLSKSNTFNFAPWEFLILSN